MKRLILVFALLSALLPLSGHAATATCTPTPDNTEATTIVDAACHSWAVSSTGQITYDGAVITGTGSVKQLATANKVIWQLTTAGNWYSIVRSAAGVFSTGKGPTTVSPLPSITVTPPPPPPPTAPTRTMSVTLPSADDICLSFASGDVVRYSATTNAAAMSKVPCQ